MREAEKLDDSDRQVLRRIKDKTFVLRGKTWTDTAFKDAMLAQLRSIEAWSEEYLELLQKQPELGRSSRSKGACCSC
jgi:hypothetical protein